MEKSWVMGDKERNEYNRQLEERRKQKQTQRQSKTSRESESVAIESWRMLMGYCVHYYIEFCGLVSYTIVGIGA